MTSPPVNAALTPSGKLGKTASYCALFMLLGMLVAVIGPSLGRLAEQTHTSLGLFSWFFVARSLGYLAGALLGGMLYDRLPGHAVMATALAFSALLVALIPLASWYWLLLLVMSVLGIASGVLDVGGNTLLVWLHREKSAPFMNAAHFFFGLGGFVAPVILAQVILRTGGIRWGYWSLALLALPVLMSLALQSSPAPLVKQGQAQAGQVNWPLVVLIVLFFFAYVGAERAIGDWIASYARATELADEVNAAYLTSFFWAAMTIGRLLGIPISARLRPHNLLLIDLLGCLLSLGLILIFPGSWLALQAGASGLGLCMATIYPTMLTFAGSHMAISGRITSIFFIGSGLGGMFTSWLVSLIFEPLGARVVTSAMLVNLLLALGLFIVMLRIASPRKKI